MLRYNHLEIKQYRLSGLIRNTLWCLVLGATLQGHILSVRLHKEKNHVRTTDKMYIEFYWVSVKYVSRPMFKPER